MGLKNKISAMKKKKESDGTIKGMGYVNVG